METLAKFFMLYKHPAAKIAGVYLVVGVVWILVSDSVVDFLFSASVRDLFVFQLAKGILYVTVTAWMLYLLVQASMVSHKMMEERLQTERNTLQSLIDALPDYVYVTSRHGGYRQVNRATTELLGLSHADPHVREAGKIQLEKHGMDLVHAVYDTKASSLNVEEHVITRHGPMVLLTSRVPVINADEEVQEVVVVSRDITELRLQQEVIESYRKNLEIIFANTNENILLLDREGRAIMFNKAMEQAIYEIRGEYPRVGEFVWNLTSPRRAQKAQETVQRVANGEYIRLDVSFATSKGNIILDLRYNPVEISGRVEYMIVLSTDVTAIRKQEIELRQSEANLKGIFNNTTEMFALLDEELNILTFNQAFYNGWLLANRHLFTNPDPAITAEAAIGRCILEFVENTRQDFLLQIAERLHDGETFNYVRRVGEDAQSQWFDVSISRIQRPDQRHGFMIALIDQTGIHQAKESLLESETRFRSLVENSNDLYTIISKEGTFSYISPNVTRILGYTQEELLQMAPADVLLIPDSATDSYSGSVCPKGSVIIHALHKDGHLRMLEGSDIKLYEQPGIRGRILVLHDITEMKRREEQILELNRSLAHFQHAIYRSSLVSRSNKNGQITFVNDNFVEASGYSREELIGQNHSMVNSGFHPHAFWKQMWETIGAGNIWRQDVMNKRKDGSYYWVDTFIMPLVDELGDVYEYFSIRHDITARKNAERELENSKYLLDKANELARIGYWTYEPAANRVLRSETAARVLGLPQSFEGSIEEYINNVHPDDRARVETAVRQSLDGTQQYDIDHRIVLQDGTHRWVHEETKPVYTAEGKLHYLIGIVQDITERKVAEEILREYNERFEILSRATNDAVWDWDMVNDYVIWNHGLETIFGYTDSTIIHPRLWASEHVHPLDISRVRQTIQYVFDHHLNVWSEYIRFQSASGLYKYVLCRAYITYNNNQEPIRMIGSMQDITELKESLEEVEKLSLVASKTSNVVIITDPLFRIEWVNKAFTELTGYWLHDIKGLSPDTFLNRVGADGHSLSSLPPNPGKEPVYAEVIGYLKDGPMHWFKQTVTPVFDDNHQTRNFILVLSDITEQKEYERKLVNVAEELKNLIEHANVPIFGMDTNGCINEWNQVTATISGYTKEEVMGRNWTEISPLRTHMAVRRVLRQVEAGTALTSYELPFAAKDGRELIFLVAVSPRRDVSNERVGVICVAQDLTELFHYRNHLEQMVDDRTRELHQALRKEKDLVDMKSRFVSIASHEFRTPLTSISMASGFLRKYHSRLTGPEIQMKLENIDKQVDHMTWLLDDVLLLGKAEAGKVVVQQAPIILREFTEKILEEVQESTRHTHAINLHWSGDALEIETDEKLMRNIVINLLTNAIKFSPGQSAVTMDVYQSRHTLRVIVSDQGIGIPQEDRDKMFQSFQRGSNVKTIPGTGLGLSIVKKAVELLNGHITVESVPGSGSTFTVTLPLMKRVAEVA